MEFLYHGSRTIGLTQISPRHSTHGKVVYATAEWLLAFYFAGSQWTRGTGFQHIRVAKDGVVEFIGDQTIIDAWFECDHGVAIYQVPADPFDEDTQWTGWEAISSNPVDVLSEERIDNWGETLHDLVVEGKIRLVLMV